MKLKILLSLIVLFVMSLIFQGCGILKNKGIKNVKESRTIDHPDVTLGDTINYFATDAVWSGKMEVRQDGPSFFLVSVKGTFDLGKIYSDVDASSKSELVILFIVEGTQNIPYKMQNKNGKVYDGESTSQFINQMRSIYSDEAFFSRIDVNTENLVALLAENYKKIVNVGKKGNVEYERGNYEKMDNYFAEGRKIYRDSKRITEKLMSPELSLSERDKDTVKEAFEKIKYIYDECGMSQNYRD